jgi:hygromycin-B 4-O-kinase
MSKAKTRIEETTVINLVRENFNAKSSNFEFLKGGEVSQAFSFQVDSNTYVVKIRKPRRNKDPFEKEMIAFEHIQSQNKQIPVPNILKRGALFEGSTKLLYCISEHIPGDFIHQFPKEKHEKVDSSLIKVLYSIHSINISKTEGYGNWDITKKAPFDSWKDYILDLVQGETRTWKKITLENDYDIEPLEQACKKVEELLDYCSEKRYLVHADYGYDNALADENGNITGVFDWEDSVFGDFVYDIAWLDFWAFRSEKNYETIYKKLYKNSELLDFTNFDERIKCYKLAIGVTALSFFIDSDQKEKYLSTKKLVLDLL